MIKLPKKQRRCPHCKKVIDTVPRKPRYGRFERLLELFESVGRNGLTDEEVDMIVRWGHQSTTPAMRYMRYFDHVFQVGEDDGTPITRTTKRKRQARVNVLAKYI